MSSQYKKQIDKMIWSYSRVNSYDQCPSGWKLHYIDHEPQESSAFAEWGSLCHSIFEDYAKGNLMAYELGEAYQQRYYDYVHSEFPPIRGEPLCDRYYNRGFELFSSFEGFPECWEILGVELEVTLKIDGKTFTGFIDLLVRNKNTGRLIVVDHKSKSSFKDPDEQMHYALQLYLYAMWVYDTYKEYPETLLFNMFRVGETVEIQFSEQDMLKAEQWFTSTIERIYQDVDFWDKITLEYEAKNKDIRTYKNDDFFCKYLCGSRTSCGRSGLKGREELL